jgi:hypothetical protein
MYTCIANGLSFDKDKYDEQYSVDRKALKRFVKKTLKTPLNQLDQDTRDAVIIAQEGPVLRTSPFAATWSS